MEDVISPEAHSGQLFLQFHIALDESHGPHRTGSAHRDLIADTPACFFIQTGHVFPRKNNCAFFRFLLRLSLQNLHDMDLRIQDAVQKQIGP